MTAERVELTFSISDDTPKIRNPEAPYFGGPSGWFFLELKRGNQIRSLPPSPYGPEEEA
jgi:hypothetical protein